ncbi:MAG: SRPBCC family protein [Marmoricola sp.]
MSYVRDEHVGAPAQRVWDLLVDVEGWPRWTRSMREITRLDDGPLAVGSRSRVVQPRGRPMVWTVTELEPLDTFTWETAMPGIRLVAVHRIEQTAEGVRTMLQLTVSGPLAWLASALAGDRMRGYVGMESEGLKHAAEHG